MLTDSKRNGELLVSKKTLYYFCSILWTSWLMSMMKKKKVRRLLRLKILKESFETNRSSPLLRQLITLLIKLRPGIETPAASITRSKSANRICSAPHLREIFFSENNDVQRHLLSREFSFTRTFKSSFAKSSTFLAKSVSPSPPPSAIIRNHKAFPVCINTSFSLAV